MNDARDTRQGSSLRGRALWLAAALVLLVGVAIATAMNLRDYFTVAEVRLPDLIGMSQDQAALVLRREGLEPVSFVQHVAGAAPAAVTSQAPLPGSIVKRGRTVHLGVNTPPADARLPDLVGMREADALERVVELGIVVGSVSYQASERAAGTVIAQQPVGGERLGVGGSLELVVSRGRDLPLLTVPDLQGQNVDSAVAELRRLGFTRVETLPSTVSFTAPNSVVGMQPGPGSQVRASTPVALHYSLSSTNVVSVPDVIGYPQWRAQLALQAAQLRLGPITYVDDPTQPEGVLSVNPTGYTLPGTPILLTINGTEPAPLPSFGFPPAGDIEGGSGTSGTTGVDLGGQDAQSPETGSATIPGTNVQLQADGSRVVPFNFDPTFMGVRRLLEQPYSLRLVVSDDRGERAVLDTVAQPGEVVSASVTVYGDEALLQTYIDDVFFQAWRP